jgi:hypothetical protein
MNCNFIADKLNEILLETKNITKIDFSCILFYKNKVSRISPNSLSLLKDTLINNQYIKDIDFYCKN